MNTLANATSSVPPLSTPINVAVASSLIDDPSWRSAKIILGPMLATAIYFLVGFFFPDRPLADKLHNRIPPGPRGLPIVGKVLSPERRTTTLDL